MPHYICPVCKRHYHSDVVRNATCKFCPANWRLSSAPLQPGENKVVNKNNPVIGNVIVPDNPFALLEKYQPPELKNYTRRKKPKASVDEISIDGALFSRPKRTTASKFTPDQIRSFGSGTQDLDDFDYEPPPRSFNIGMRLTAGTVFKKTCRDFKSVVTSPHLKKEKTAQISGKAGRQATNAIMGIHIYTKGTCSASKISGRGKYFVGGKSHDEWCHLIGDALGGPTTADNLVAGSYGANTHMAVLEILLQGRTELELTVTAHCSAAHVAEFINFSVCHKTKAKTFDCLIDARNQFFTKEDMESEQTALKDWLKSVGITIS